MKISVPKIRIGDDRWRQFCAKDCPYLDNEVIQNQTNPTNLGRCTLFNYTLAGDWQYKRCKKCVSWARKFIENED